MKRAALLAAAAACLVAAWPAAGATPPLATGPPALAEDEAVAAFLTYPKVARWLDRYPASPLTDGTFDREKRTWTVNVWSGKAGEIATGTVADADGHVVEAWTGPQVAWKMARGRPGAFGGKQLNSWPVWLGLSAIFLVGLTNLRRPLSMRTLDLLVLLSFGISLAFFNRGEVFESAALAVPPLVYLAVRTAWIGYRASARPGSTAVVWPVWALAVATVFLVGFRIGLNVDNGRTVIDVGYAGVIGADQIADGDPLYGNFPDDNHAGDTYGPVSYYAYVPFEQAFPWSGEWDELPAAHAAAIFFDLAVLAGLFLLGRRLWSGERGTALGSALAFAWAACPYSSYALESNTNDSLLAALLVASLLVIGSAPLRGAMLAAASATAAVYLRPTASNT